MGEDAMQLKRVKAKANGRRSGLAGVSVVPERLADPVAQFRMLVFCCHFKPDCANQCSTCAQGNCKDEIARIAFIGFERTYPRLSHAFGIWMRNAQRRCCNVAVARKARNVRRIGQNKWPKQEPLSVNMPLAGHTSRTAVTVRAVCRGMTAIAVKS